MHDLYKQKDLPYLAVKLCPNCEKLIDVNSKICSNCSYDFNAKIIMKQEVPINNNTKSDDIDNNTSVKISKKEEKKEPEKFVYCEHCGSKIVGQQRFCSCCGTRASKRICLACNQIIDSNLSFCPLCGEKQEGVVVQDITATGMIDQRLINNETGAPVVNFENNDYVSQLNPNNVYDTNLLDNLNNNENNDDNNDNTNEDDNVNNDLNNEFECLADSINIGRKRLFIVIQLLIMAIIAAIMVMVPILTKESFFVSIIPSFSGQVENAKISLIDLFWGLVNGNIYVQEDPLYSALCIENNYIFTSMPLVNELVSSFTAISKLPDYFISLISVIVVYGLIIISMIIMLISSIVGFFRKTPFKGNALGMLVISLLIGCLVIYLGSIVGPYTGYDSWLIYAFTITFLLWFIIKLVFGKETRVYKRLKRNGLQ